MCLEGLIPHPQGVAEACGACHGQLVAGEIIAILPCRHCFHPECARQSLRAGDLCPECGTDVYADWAQHGSAEGQQGFGRPAQPSSIADGAYGRPLPPPVDADVPGPSMPGRGGVPAAEGAAEAEMAAGMPLPVPLLPLPDTHGEVKAVLAAAFPAQLPPQPGAPAPAGPVG